MKLTIDRKKWNGGAEPSKSSLLNLSGKMCCLGFYCLAVGKTEDEIYCKTMPSMVEDTTGLELLLNQESGLNDVIKSRSNDLAKVLAHVNDADDGDMEDRLGIGPTHDWTLPQREAKITELFKEIDVEVEFIN